MGKNGWKTSSKNLLKIGVMEKLKDLSSKHDIKWVC